ncbi:MAG: glycoside hydrolase family 2 protein [Thermoleophilaceae bacterium]
MGRLLLGGTWYFRLDDARAGEQLGFARQRSLSGWQPVSIPHNWNARDTTLNSPSHGWYRRELVLPRGPRKRRTLWVARFEGVNHRTNVYLNGREIARHSGGYAPFEVDLDGLRPGRNRLVLRVSTLRSRTDLTHWRPATANGYGTGGWWNFGGMSREVYVRPVQGLDIDRVAVLPHMRCTRCPARVEVRARVRNTAPEARRVRLKLRLRKRVVAELVRRFDGGERREIVTRFTVRRPRLWRVGGRGKLYGLRVTAGARRPPPARRKPARKRGARSSRSHGTGGRLRRGRALGRLERATYRTTFGLRKIRKRSDGTVLLNGRAMRLKGVSLHEDDPVVGAAWGPPQRREALKRIVELGANVVRAHYPLHPAMLEALDRRGVLVWSQAPVYQVPESSLALGAVQRRAVAANRSMVLRDRSHPSVFVWSIANELPESVGAGQAAFIEAAAREVRRLDPTRLVAIDRATRLGGPEGHAAVRALDALGVNEYFGWYYSAVPGLAPASDPDLGSQLDGLHAAYPGVALFVTEFGAESNRGGPDSEKGTFDFQTRWTRDHLAVHRSRPFVNGSIIWALKDFRVHPTWGGGNPLPGPPYNNKGLIEESGAPKPAFYEVKRLFGGG